MSADPTPNSRRAKGRRALDMAAIVIGVVMQVVVAVPFTAGLGLMAPPLGIVAGWALWLVGVASLVVTVRRRPLLVPVVPLANAGLLFTLVTFGEFALGWSP